MSSETYDVAICGNGAIGCALAFELVRKNRDVRVALVGPAERSGSASLAAGAMLGAFAEVEPGVFDDPIAAKKLDMAVHAARAWPAWLDALNARAAGEEPVVVEKGTHVVASPRSHGEDDLSLGAMIAALERYGEPFREVDPREIRGVDPHASSRPHRAVHLENEGLVRSTRLHRAYDTAFAREPRIARFDDTATSIDPSGAGSRVLLASGRAVRARHVVLAAGAASQALLDSLGLSSNVPRLFHGVGTALVLHRDGIGPRQVFRSPNRGLLGGVYVVPYDRYCYVGASNLVRVEASTLPRVADIASLLAAATEQVHAGFADATVHKILVGSRPTTADAFPLLGQTSVSGVWTATGTRRDGFHLSPLIARELAACIDTGRQPFDGVFRPERTLLLGPKAPAVRRAVAQLVALRSRGAEPSPEIERAARAEVEGIYAKCGLDRRDHGIPPELLGVYGQGLADDGLRALFAAKAAR